MTGIFAKLEGSHVGFEVADGILQLKVHTHGVENPGLDSILSDPQSQVLWCKGLVASFASIVMSKCQTQISYAQNTAKMNLEALIQKFEPC